ncbi:hypothetical protein HKX48_008671 [Thoreauomyces humboldtii]|nr:hypothetical protein HKX48_008671 [Thoreauomyces humboldtii]
MFNDPAETEAEIQHFDNVVRAFQQYRLHSLTSLAKKRRDVQSMSSEHLALVGGTLSSKLASAEFCVNHNAEVIATMLHDQDFETVREGSVRESDMDKVKTTLRQFARDWSDMGRKEREEAYDPILLELETRFPNLSTEERGALRVLVPGAGLGRLAFDIVKKGFSCQGNEFSFFMLLASNFILNRAKKRQEFEVYPWIHSFSNHLSTIAQFQSAHIPDVVPGGIPKTADFSMVAGDFLAIYNSPDNEGAWDVIVTCFFVDTAKNILEYVDTIHHALKSTGLWINIGPLLYHWEGMESHMSIELTLQEFKDLVVAKGFRLENERNIATTYTSNPTSMLKYVYDCAYFCAVKE